MVKLSDFAGHSPQFSPWPFWDVMSQQRKVGQSLEKEFLVPCSGPSQGRTVTRHYAAVNPWRWQIMTEADTECGKREEKHPGLHTQTQTHRHRHTDTHTHGSVSPGQSEGVTAPQRVEKFPLFKMWEAQE